RAADHANDSPGKRMCRSAISFVPGDCSGFLQLQQSVAWKISKFCIRFDDDPSQPMITTDRESDTGSAHSRREPEASEFPASACIAPAQKPPRAGSHLSAPCPAAAKAGLVRRPDCL